QRVLGIDRRRWTPSEIRYRLAGHAQAGILPAHLLQERSQIGLQAGERHPRQRAYVKAELGMSWVDAEEDASAQGHAEVDSRTAGHERVCRVRWLEAGRHPRKHLGQLDAGVD